MILHKGFLIFFLVFFSAVSLANVISPGRDTLRTNVEKVAIPLPLKVVIEKALLYNNYTLEDVYAFRDTTRCFQWDKIESRLKFLDSIQREHDKWAILRNYKNIYGEAPLVRTYQRNEYGRVSDSLGVERYQSVPLYELGDSLIPLRYGRDGSLVKRLSDSARYIQVEAAYHSGIWNVPLRYVKFIADTVVFHNVIFVDLTNQNITTLEKVNSKWLVRSMNPATTGLHRPPYQHETPQGIFVIQEKKSRMIFNKDGTNEVGGFSPWASRFCNGGYIHGVPVNKPATELIEFSSSLGTTPRSHMCVRNVTSHAKFIYDWAPTEATIVFIFD